MQSNPTTYTESAARRTARRGLRIYFVIVVALSPTIEGFVIRNPELDGLIAGLMLVPALASVVARLVLREGFSDVSFRFGGQEDGVPIGFALALVLTALTLVIAAVIYSRRRWTVIQSLPRREMGLKRSIWKWWSRRHAA